MPKDAVADAIRDVLVSPNEADRNSEPANLVDAVFAVARSIGRLADAVENLTAEVATRG